MQVFDQVQESVVATDLSGSIVNWNRGAERLHGYSAEEAIGRHVSLIYAWGDHVEVEFKQLSRLLESGSQEYDGVARTNPGTFGPSTHTSL
ncbi:MAG: PAS domain S-box protein [Steroidobacteraceae bacterium]